MKSLFLSSLMLCLIATGAHGAMDASSSGAAPLKRLNILLWTAVGDYASPQSLKRQVENVSINSTAKP